MSYQTAAELEKVYHELIISTFGHETDDAWVFSSKHPEIVKELDRMWHKWFERCQRDKAEQ